MMHFEAQAQFTQNAANMNVSTDVRLESCERNVQLII